MAERRNPLFLERQLYRRRRLMDAARILPVAGLIALLLPVLWSRDGAASTATEALYLFGLWFCLILAAGLLSRPLRQTQDRDGEFSRPAAPPAPPRAEVGPDPIGGPDG